MEQEEKGWAHSRDEAGATALGAWSGGSNAAANVRANAHDERKRDGATGDVAAVQEDNARAATGTVEGNDRGDVPNE